MSWLREANAEPIPGYRLVEPLGSGGFGEVWKCIAPGGVPKAIKFVYGNLNSLDIDAVRAEQEKSALERIKSIRHTFICSLDRIEEVEGELVIVMELADKTLHDLCEERKQEGHRGIPADELWNYLRDAAEALDYMNEEHQLQHLDVKPKNLFLIAGRVKVADFGLVKHIEKLSGVLGGVTPLYAAPETFNGKISKQSDQYSLAIVYQELLTGHRPFTGKNIRQLAQQHLQGQPDLRALPEAERSVVAQALSKDPEKRFPNCLAFMRALHRARLPVRITVPEPANASLHPKTVADTMEDIRLEDAFLPTSPEELAELAGPGDRLDQLQESVLVSDLGLTVLQPETGVLRPTLFIGVGGFGRKALLELRCRLVDRFGNLDRVPMFRYLCIDPDPDAASTAIRGAPEVALSRQEVYPIPVQPVSNYRRKSLEQLSEWLPREKLYSMPRSRQLQGCRALGRLAFVDNQQRLVAKIRREIQEITNPDHIYRSVNDTGLALRDAVPRVFIFASASGGSSGMLLDLGYAIKRQLEQLRHLESSVTLMLMCSAPNDPASPRWELANVHATLTEINHFTDSSIPFSAEYGADGRRLVDEGSPFHNVYLLPLAHRSPEAVDDVLTHVGNYVFHETTTPLGARLDKVRFGKRSKDHADYLNTPFRSLGTYAVWFPRGLLLRLASRLACRRVIETWLAAEDDSSLNLAAASPEISLICDQLVSIPEMDQNQLTARIMEATRSANLTDLCETPDEALAAMLSSLEDQTRQIIAQEDPGAWVRQAFNRVREWVGGGDVRFQVKGWRKTRIHRALIAAASKVAAELTESIASGLYTVMDKPGSRIAAAEQALSYLEDFCNQQAEAMQVQLASFKQRIDKCWSELESAMDDCITGQGGFRLFGGRSNRRLLQIFIEKVRQFAAIRLEEEKKLALEQFYHSLRGGFADHKRDLGFCRQRLRYLQENLDIPFTAIEEDLASTRVGAELTVSRTPLGPADGSWDIVRETRTARVVLPDQEQDLERAAVRLLHRLKPEDWNRLDMHLHEQVLKPRNGLRAVCRSGGDLIRLLAMPLVEETVQLLSDFLPVMDVAQILANEWGFREDSEPTPEELEQNVEFEARVRKYFDRCKPVIKSTESESDYTFLLVPASQAGAVLSHAIKEKVPELKQVKVPGQADLMFCRDNGPLTYEELKHMFKLCGTAYDEVAPVPATSPHARFDILDWMPLDP